MNNDVYDEFGVNTKNSFNTPPPMTIEPIQLENKKSFHVKHLGKQYIANIWLDQDSYKFIDWEILEFPSGEKVDQDIEDEIIQYIDKNWEKL